MRRLDPGRVVAVPVGAADTCDEFTADADEVVCATEPEPFRAVGYWYEDFSQTTDDEVRELLTRDRPLTPAAGPGAPSPASRTATWQRSP